MKGENPPGIFRILCNAANRAESVKDGFPRVSVLAVIHGAVCTKSEGYSPSYFILKWRSTKSIVSFVCSGPPFWMPV